MFVTTVFLHENGFLDMGEASVFSSAMALLIFLPFLVFVIAKGIADSWRIGSPLSQEIEGIIAPIFARFLWFAAGMLLAFIPGSVILFATIM